MIMQRRRIIILHHALKWTMTKRNCCMCIVHSLQVLINSPLHNDDTIISRNIEHKIIIDPSQSFLAGPEKWGELFPLALGKRQSPIDISTQSTTKGSELADPLQIKYVPENTRSLVNPGYCWRVDVNGTGSELTGGPLGGDKYVLEQFHAHWGASDDKGSEHTVDGQAFAGELHLVHWNQTKYESFAEAARHPDGLAVLGVFIKVSGPLQYSSYSR